LCLIPPLRDWFADIDRLATDARLWRAAQSRNVVGTDAEQAAILDLLSYLTPRRAVKFDKIRLGRDGDGGYVLLDDFSCVSAALSFGIETDCSWDTAIAERGIDVHQYDHTVDGPPTDNVRFRFFKRKITSAPSDQSETLGSALAKLPPPDAGHVILKIDIEGSEWDVLDTATPEELARFSQIIGEFHELTSAADPAWRDRARRVLAKLRSAFDVVHVHGNNWSPLDIVANVAIPASVELTFANRAIYQCDETGEVFPTALDQPNWRGRPDIFLGNMRFK
jgi:hypothetical protein